MTQDAVNVLIGIGVLAVIATAAVMRLAYLLFGSFKRG